MNWQKYSLDEWLEQFGAWCDTASHDEPDDLGENMLYRLMINSGYIKRLYRCKKQCEISDSEAMAVQNLLNDVLKRANDEMRADVGLLIAHKVSGISLRKIAERKDTTIIDLRIKIHGAKSYIRGRFPIYFA